MEVGVYFLLGKFRYRAEGLPQEIHGYQYKYVTTLKVTESYWKGFKSRSPGIAALWAAHQGCRSTKDRYWFKRYRDISQGDIYLIEGRAFYNDLHGIREIQTPFPNASARQLARISNLVQGTESKKL